jgi:tetratricopeptide (TPR) repeat protein
LEKATVTAPNYFTERLLKLAEKHRIRARFAQTYELLNKVSQVWKSGGPVSEDKLPKAITDLGLVSYGLGKYRQAEISYNDAIQILSKQASKNSLSIGRPLCGLAFTASAQGKFEKAESALERAITVQRQGVNNKDARSYNILMQTYREMDFEGHSARATPFLHWLLKRIEAEKGPNTFENIEILALLGEAHRSNKKYNQAVDMFKRAIAGIEANDDHDSLKLPPLLYGLGHTYYFQSKYSEAEQILQRDLSIRENAFGKNSGALVESLVELQKVYWATKQDRKRDEMIRRIRSIDN